jgi:ribosome biogenesis protein ENP2
VPIRKSSKFGIGIPYVLNNHCLQRPLFTRLFLKPTTNFVSITPAQDLNHVHHVPGSGLLMIANEGIQMAVYYIPQLGPAPQWASFLENITEEMEDQTVRSVYEDYKFVERKELKTSVFHLFVHNDASCCLHRLGLDHLVGTTALKPYMHGYFMSLKLYDAARVIANPFAYAEHRDKMIREKMEKMAETRIRTKKDVGVKVNRALAEKILREEEKAKKKEERKQKKKVEVGMDVDEVPAQESEQDEKDKTSILNDPRFAKVFQNPEFAIDESSREYALLNPSAAAQKRSGARGKTAVEDEEEESDKFSSDGLGESDSNDDEGSDSSDAGGRVLSCMLLLLVLSVSTELTKFDPRARPGQKNARVQEAYTRDRERNRIANVNLVPMRAQGGGSTSRGVDKDAAFGQRRMGATSLKGKQRSSEVRVSEDGGMEVSWMPSSSAGHIDQDDDLASGGGKLPKGKAHERRKGVESFGAGMEKGGEEHSQLSENDRRGRTHRRKGVRSGSKNVFRRMDG